MSIQRKIALTVVVTILIGLIGAGCEYYYLEERGEYEIVIGDYYERNYGERPDLGLLRNIANLAIERYGITELYSKEERFKELMERGRHDFRTLQI